MAGEKWMVCLKPIEVTGSQIAENTKISVFGYDDWEIMPDNLFTAIIRSPDEQSMRNYINGYSDEITYNFAYIFMEYIHYFDAPSLSLPSGLYWDGPKRQYTLIWESENALTMFLDGNTYSRRRLMFKSDPSYSSYKFKEKEWNKRVAWAFVARRM